MTPAGAGVPFQKPPSCVGKRIRCPKCGQLGILRIKYISRKYGATPYLYVQHYDPRTKKVYWHYYGKLKEGCA